MKGKLTLKLTDTLKSLKTIMADVNEVKTLKEVMTLMKGEFENCAKEYYERLNILQKTPAYDFSFTTQLQ